MLLLTLSNFFLEHRVNCLARDSHS